MTDCTSVEEICQGTAEKVVQSYNRQKYLKGVVVWGDETGVHKALLCVEIDGLNFPRKDLGNLHRDDLCHHFWKVHAHHVGLDKQVKSELMQLSCNRLHRVQELGELVKTS